MTCREVDEILIQSSDSRPKPGSQAGEHVRNCQRCRRLGLLMEKADTAAEFDPQVLETIQASLLPTLKPVRPIAPTWVWIGAFVLLASAIAVIGAAVLGMHGFWAATALQITVILGVICVSAIASAMVVAREMTPASKRWISAGAVLAGSSFGVVLAFSLLFRHHGMADFIHAGVPCLATGVCFSAATALLIAVLVRRGFVLDKPGAGMAVGTLAGLAGLCLLELHCGNLSAVHLIVWHAAVLSVSGSIGWLIGRTAER